MYSGTTLNKNSGGFIGVHQKINRIARKKLGEIPGVGQGFPTYKEIARFEGNNGPDGIKRKSPSVDEPWHYIDPTKHDDTALLEMVLDHHANLVEALKSGNQERSAFESAWLSHAIVDGLTPAHHYPLSDKIEELWGKPKEARLSIKEKNLIIGDNKRDTISKNWQYWGAKGVFLTHVMFELGVATSIKTTRFKSLNFTPEWIDQADEIGLEKVFLRSVKDIYSLDMYHNYWQNGWSTKLAQESRKMLIPEIIRVVVYAWYSAYRESEL